MVMSALLASVLLDVHNLHIQGLYVTSGTETRAPVEVSLGSTSPLTHHHCRLPGNSREYSPRLPGAWWLVLRRVGQQGVPTILQPMVLVSSPRRQSNMLKRQGRRTCGRSHSIASENLEFVRARMLVSSSGPEAVYAADASASALRELRLARGGMSCSEHERHVEKTYAAKSEFA